MNGSDQTWWKRQRYTAAVIAGLFWACAFPKPGIAGFAWIAPGLLLFSARGESPRRLFRIGYAAGVTNYLTSLHWLLLIPYRWHGIPLLPFAGWLALCSYVALYPAFWVLLSWKAFPVMGRIFNRSAITTPKPPGGNSRIAAFFENSSWAQRAAWAFSSAAIWVALEMALARVIGGFPWNILGASQYKITPLTQIASITGIYGVSFLVIWFSISLASAAFLFVQSGLRRRTLFEEIILPLGAVLALGWWGYQRAASGVANSDRPTVRVALIQPSIPQEMIWQQEKTAERFDKLLFWSEQALKEKPQLLVWPEAALPGLTEENFRAITNLISSNKVWMIFGADDFEKRAGAGSEEYNAFNAAFLFNPRGEYIASYRKRRLVAFGEYLPLSGWLPLVKYLVPIGNFTSGNRAVPFHLTNPGINTSVLICFEDVFPHHTPEYVTETTDFLLNLTNDGWFGEGAAQWQQAVGAAFRAVENDVPLVRCTNNGITGWVDERGRWRQIYHDKNGNEYREGFLIATIPLLKPGEKRQPTFYRRHGDVFGWSCVGLSFLLLLGQVMTVRPGKNHS